MFAAALCGGGHASTGFDAIGDASGAAVHVIDYMHKNEAPRTSNLMPDVSAETASPALQIPDGERRVLDAEMEALIRRLDWIKASGRYGQVLPQSQNSIRVEIRYPVAYGYRFALGGVSDPVPYSCSAFQVSISLMLPPGMASVMGPPRFDASPFMRNEDGWYVCEYLIPAKLDSPTTVIARMAWQPTVERAWPGGNRPQPPPGQKRMIVKGTRTVTLTAERPCAVLKFEMAYAGAR